MADTPRYKELQQQLMLEKDGKGQVDTLLKIAEEIKNFDEEQAMQMANDIIERSEDLGYNAGIGRGMCLKGFCNRVKGEYDAGIEVLKEALDIAEKLNDRNMEATALYYLGNIYRDLGDPDNVFLHYEKALAINEELGEEFYQSVILSSIANLMYDIGDFESALEYASKCLPIFKKINNVNSLLNICNTLGNIYFKMDKYDDALLNFKENLDRSEPETAAYVMAESGIGKVYYKMQDFDNAKKYLLSALRQSKVLGNAEVQIICNFYLGRFYMDDGNYDLSRQYLLAAYSSAGSLMRRHDIMSVHEMLSLLYDKTGDIPSAFYHLKSYEKLKEEIFKQTIINKLRNLQVRQQTELAKKEKEVAERTAMLKHQFLANMSHEIRTPMNAIVGMTRLVLAKEPKPEHIHYLRAIQLSSDNLLVIINDILDLSKIESGKIIIEHIDFNLREVVQSVRDMLLLKSEEKGIELRTVIDPEIPVKLTGDPTRLNQVLINLAGNAIKFTAKGYVEISATLRKREGDKLWIQYDVKDSGIGIGPEYIDKIFESFTQAGADVTRKFGGTGLGLTISRQLANLMGGDITVQSELGKGTVFTTVIPFEQALVQEAAMQQNVLNAQSMDRLNKLKILLVEDNEFNRMVAEDTLKDTIPGINIQMAHNGRDAVDRVEKEMFDIVLMDIQMPVMDGLTATKMIRSTLHAPANGVKIIAMTANVMQEEVQQYFVAGMNAYISKPFNPDELLLKMDAVMGDSAPVGNKEQEQYAPGQDQELQKLPERVTDMKFMDAFTGGKADKKEKYVKIFLDNAPKLLNNIYDALSAQNYQSIKMNAHTLIPQLSYMGVKDDVSKISIIEHSAGIPEKYATLPQLIAGLKQVCEKAFEELKNDN